jgi:hypothetical protein
MTRRFSFAVLFILLAACVPRALAAPCTIRQANRAISRDIVELSGLSLSRRSPGVLWTHNDSGHEPYLFAVDSTGATLSRVRVTGARLIDWEDMASGPCDAGNCLFVGDIGDNSGRRDSISIYVVPEPALTDSATAPATVLNLRYPDHPRDAEAMFVLPNGDLYLVSKGRRDSVALFRLAKAAQQPATLTTLEQVRALWSRPRERIDRVTGASASPDGQRVAIRTYRSLFIFSTDGLLGGGGPIQSIGSGPIDQKVGEAVALTDSGTIWLGSEGSGPRPPELARIACALPGQ